ncbi:MAG: hypothetical protein QM752_01175 [Gammaproteobacteria bacterium]
MAEELPIKSSTAVKGISNPSNGIAKNKKNKKEPDEKKRNNQKAQQKVLQPNSPDTDPQDAKTTLLQMNKTKEETSLPGISTLGSINRDTCLEDIPITVKDLQDPEVQKSIFKEAYARLQELYQTNKEGLRTFGINFICISAVAIEPLFSYFLFKNLQKILSQVQKNSGSWSKAELVEGLAQASFGVCASGNLLVDMTSVNVMEEIAEAIDKKPGYGVQLISEAPESVNVKPEQLYVYRNDDAEDQQKKIGITTILPDTKKPHEFNINLSLLEKVETLQSRQKDKKSQNSSELTDQRLTVAEKDEICHLFGVEPKARNRPQEPKDDKETETGYTVRFGKAEKGKERTDCLYLSMTRGILQATYYTKEKAAHTKEINLAALKNIHKALASHKKHFNFSDELALFELLQLRPEAASLNPLVGMERIKDLEQQDSPFYSKIRKGFTKFNQFVYFLASIGLTFSDVIAIADKDFLNLNPFSETEFGLDPSKKLQAAFFFPLSLWIEASGTAYYNMFLGEQLVKHSDAFIDQLLSKNPYSLLLINGDTKITAGLLGEDKVGLKQGKGGNITAYWYKNNRLQQKDVTMFKEVLPEFPKTLVVKEPELADDKKPSASASLLLKREGEELNLYEMLETESEAIGPTKKQLLRTLTPAEEKQVREHALKGRGVQVKETEPKLITAYNFMDGVSCSSKGSSIAGAALIEAITKHCDCLKPGDTTELTRAEKLEALAVNFEKKFRVGSIMVYRTASQINTLIDTAIGVMHTPEEYRGVVLAILASLGLGTAHVTYFSRRLQTEAKLTFSDLDSQQMQQAVVRGWDVLSNLALATTRGIGAGGLMYEALYHSSPALRWTGVAASALAFSMQSYISSHYLSKGLVCRAENLKQQEEGIKKLFEDSNIKALFPGVKTETSKFISYNPKEKGEVAFDKVAKYFEENGKLSNFIQATGNLIARSGRILVFIGFLANTAENAEELDIDIPVNIYVGLYSMLLFAVTVQLGDMPVFGQALKDTFSYFFAKAAIGPPRPEDQERSMFVRAALTFWAKKHEYTPEVLKQAIDRINQELQLEEEREAKRKTQEAKETSNGGQSSTAKSFFGDWFKKKIHRNLENRC